jgi:predicted nucleic acid-binding protein
LGRLDFAAQAARERPAEGGMSGITLDAGALIELDRNDRRVIALLARAAELGARITVPATALAQAIRAPSKQARLSRLVRQPKTHVVPLDASGATQVGLLLAGSRTSDIADAHVVICAKQHDDIIVTTDPSDLRRLNPRARIFAL